MLDRSNWVWEEPYYTWINGFEQLIQKGYPPDRVGDNNCFVYRCFSSPRWKPANRWPKRGRTGYE